jgi:hypothetical protein
MNEIKINRGDSSIKTIDVQDDSGLDFNCSGYTPIMIVTYYENDDLPLFTITGSTNTNQLIFNITSANTMSLAERVYFYQVYMVKGLEKITVIDATSFSVAPLL